MNDPALLDYERNVSLFTVGTHILRQRWRVIGAMFAGAVLMAILAFAKPALYAASASFVSRGSDPARSGLASLAGQFGISLSTGDRSLTPEFYARLINSREVLAVVVRDTLVVEEDGGRKKLFADLMKVTGASQADREERAVKELRDLLSVSVSKQTGIIEFSVATRWRSVSLAVVRGLIESVNRFNQRVRREQAEEERKFVEGRLGDAAISLRNAEDRMQRFLQSNRQYASSAELTFERDRLQRDLLLQQQIFNSLTQSFEEVRIREVRDTPVITMIELPAASVSPQPRGRVTRTLMGAIVGGVLGVFAILLGVFLSPHGREEASEIDEFLHALREAGDPLVRRFRRSAHGS